MTTIIAATTATAVAMTKNFNTGAQNAAGSMNALTTNVNGNIQNMISATVAFASAITKNFGQGAQNAAGSMNALASNVASNASNMVSNIGRVVSAMNNIGSAANSARSQVQSLISSINSIPASKTVTINIIEHRTVVTTLRTVGGILSFSNIVAAALNGEAPSSGTTTTTTLSSAASSSRPKVIRLEISEPTIVKVDGRELVKQINKKLLELDIGALT